MGRACGIPKYSCYYRRLPRHSLNMLLVACPKLSFVSNCFRQHEHIAVADFVFHIMLTYPVPPSICKKIESPKATLSKASSTLEIFGAEMCPHPCHPMTNSPALCPPSEKPELAYDGVCTSIFFGGSVFLGKTKNAYGNLYQAFVANVIGPRTS